jgi:hypothetical protein
MIQWLVCRQLSRRFCWASLPPEVFHKALLMLVKRFEGRVVKRMRRVPGGILLTFLSMTPGTRGQQVTITQSQWDSFGTESYEAGVSLTQLRRQQLANWPALHLALD